MMSPIRFLFASLLALVSACSESANQSKPIQQSRDGATPYQTMKIVAQSTPSRFIAGLAPNHRPEHTPVIREYAVSEQQRKQALTGISQPTSSGFAFIDDQQAWFTPFNRPGMIGYYDLRTWHANSPELKRASQ